MLGKIAEKQSSPLCGHTRRQVLPGVGVGEEGVPSGLSQSPWRTSNTNQEQNGPNTKPRIDTGGCRQAASPSLPARLWAERGRSPGPEMGEPGLRALEAFLEAAVVLLSLENEDCRRVQGWATGRTEDLLSDIRSDAW